MLFWILLSFATTIALAILAISYICFRMAFYVPRRKPTYKYKIEFPEGEIYKPFHNDMAKWAREVRSMPHEDMMTISFDGLHLYGKFYEFAPGAPIELMFHGYRGNAERDLPGGVQRCFKLGRSALIVDQRCCGNSEGNVITFGVHEHRDCLAWIDFMLGRFGPDVKIILTGISMGASTVMMCADKKLPENVIGILADCGYTSPRSIIKHVIRQKGLPVNLSYFFVRLGARLYGDFDPNTISCASTLRRATVPVIFFHGEEDDFVPCRMSRVNYRSCATRKMLLTVPGAGHGLSYPIARETYLQALRDFFGPEASFGGL